MIDNDLVGSCPFLKMAKGVLVDTEVRDGISFLTLIPKIELSTHVLVDPMSFSGRL